MVFVFFFKQKTAYEMRISDWSSDVCSSDLIENAPDEDDVPSPFQTVGGRRGKAYRAGSVHLDLTVFGTGPSANLHRLWTDLALAGLIIHEAPHKFCFTEDHA